MARSNKQPAKRKRHTLDSKSSKSKTTNGVAPETNAETPKDNRVVVGDPGIMTTPRMGSEVGALFFNSVNNRQVTPHSSNPVSSTILPSQGENDLEKSSKKWIAACQKSGRMGSSEILARDLNQYVRYDLFPKLKFIMSKNQMHFIKAEGSFCSTICSAMGLVGDDDVTVSWWEAHKDTILAILKSKCADVTAGIKRAFVRK